MQICRQCILPETYPGIHFDEKGVCNICKEYDTRKAKEKENHLSSEAELAVCLEKYRQIDNKYHVLVPVSGGVDSCAALIHMVKVFKITPLAFHNDHGFEDETALSNIKKLCKALDVDLFIWQHDLNFMKKLWRFSNETHIHGLNSCYLCGNILYTNALEAAHRFDIRLVINGYSKGQAALIENTEKGRQLYEQILETMAPRVDRQFFDEFIKKNQWLTRQRIYSSRQDLENPVDPEKILVVPFYVFKFYKTNKDELKKQCREVFDWQPIPVTYPTRTTNCQINLLNTYMDLKKMNYSMYTDEYAELIRCGEISRQQALKDLEFNPPPGLVENLSRQIGVHLEGKKEPLVVEAKGTVGDEGDFDF